MKRVVQFGAMNCSVVIPIYRGEQTISPLIQRLAKTLPTLFNRYEVILVNDGSPDRSWDLILQLSRKYKFLRGIRLLRNYGQHNATLCGVRAAKYELIVTMDQDLQHPPEEIAKMLEKLNEGFDVVYGSPIKLPQGLIRNLLTSNIKNILAKVMKTPSVKNISAFRLFRTELRSAFENFQNPALILDVLLSWGTTRFASIAVDIQPATKSNYSFSALVKTALLILTGYSTLPLRMASLIGFFMTLFGFGILVYVLLVYFLLGSLPGFSFLASMTAIFSGTQMFTLGILGEYLARMFDQSMGRPSYVVQQETGSREK